MLKGVRQCFRYLKNYELFGNAGLITLNQSVFFFFIDSQSRKIQADDLFIALF